MTVREMDVLLALADGLANSEIATELHIGLDTVEGYVKMVMRKLGAKNRTHAVALAYHRGLLVKAGTAA